MKKRANGFYTLAGSPTWRLVLNPLVPYTSITVYLWMIPNCLPFSPSLIFPFPFLIGCDPPPLHCPPVCSFRPFHSRRTAGTPTGRTQPAGRWACKNKFRFGTASLMMMWQQNTCYSTVTCKVLYWINPTSLNQPQHKLGQSCANSWRKSGQLTNRHL